MPETPVEEYGYAGRVHGCGCAVMLISADASYADSAANQVADAIRDGLYVERLTVEACRESFHRCRHSRPERPGRGAASLYRVEYSVLVSAASEDEAERIGSSVIRGGDGDSRCVELYSRVAVKDADEIFREEGEDGEIVSVSFLSWLTEPLTDAESAEAYRIQLEQQGQGTLPGLAAHQ